jgi:integrase/recombinase XerC
MSKSEHLTLLKPAGYSTLQAALDTFLLSRQAARCTPKTLEHYTYTCGNFASFLQERAVTTPEAITPNHIRQYLVALQRQGLKDTTQHAHARGIKTWLRWLVREGDLAENPMLRVDMPRLDARIPPPFSPDDVNKLLSACDRSVVGLRNRAIVIGLLDSGLRLSEFVSLRVGDVNMRTGLCSVMGKGRKMRQVCFGAKSRAVMVKYLAALGDVEQNQPLWGLTTRGLQVMLHRLGRRAGVRPCGAHRFRRTFALWMLRDGCDLHSLRLLMGHSDLSILQRYLALAGEDIERAHKAHSPADTLLERW